MAIKPILEVSHRNKRISACFLCPTQNLHRYYSAMFQLIAQWRVGHGYVRRGALTLTIGQERIWDSHRGWHEVRAGRMLRGKRTVCGSRREVNHDVEVKMYRRF